MKKLHLGCGSNYMEGYTNIDFPPEEHNVNHNVKVDKYDNILTMQYEKCNEIRSHHVFEHFKYFESFALLYKWTLALNIGGKLIIDVPDLEELCKAYLSADSKTKYLVTRYIFGSHEGNWAVHSNNFSESILIDILSNLGFKIENVNKYGSCNDKQPNCGICVTAIKETEYNNDIVVQKLSELLKLYKNGDTDFENSLWRYFDQEFRKIIK